ncbi:hypothetical protein KL910_004304 [Ogataea haglerorum]|nr:hypothetical protein KL945_003497 [Ogataea haglerorum]KAG7786457.1 hypothetical protein KL910_004304 [Ogataea haglerorum]
MSLLAFQSLSADEKIVQIDLIKLAVLGNDREKAKLQDSFGVLGEILLTESNKTLLQNTAIIVQSFSYLRTNVEFLLRFNIFEVLVKSTIRYPAVLAEINFRTLIDLLSTNSLSEKYQDEREYAQFVGVLAGILRDPAASPALLFNTYLLIPFLRHTELLWQLYRPLMRRLAQVVSPVFQQTLRLNCPSGDVSVLKRFPECVELPRTLPEHAFEALSNDLSPPLYALALLLAVIDRADLNLPLPLYFVLTTFLGSYDLNVKLSSVNVLVQYTKKHIRNPKERTTSHARLIEALVHLISRTKDSHGPEYTLSSNYKIPRTMSPLYLLSQIAEEDPSNSDALVEVNFVDTIASIVTANYSSDRTFLDEDTLYKISDSLLILSCIAGLREDYRELVIRYDVAPVIVDSITRHAKIYRELDSRKPTPADVGVLKLSNRITLSSCYLLRSLSRSASLLRTYLVELKLVRKLVDLLHIPDDIIENCPDELRLDEIRLKSVVLGIVSNSIVEFSAVKHELASDELALLLRRFIYESRYDSLRMNSLWVIKNSLFGGNRESKENFQTTVSLDKIFELCGDPNERIQEHSFDILRNLAVGHFNYANKIMADFSASELARRTGQSSFLDFLCAHLEKTSNPDVIVAIIYVVVHLAASNENNRALIMCNQRLLKKLVGFLEYSERVPDDEDHWKIRLSVVWAVLNLSWREETTGSDLDNDDDDSGEDMDVDAGDGSDFRRFLSPKNRALRLIELGFYDAIRTLNNHCTISDFKERARMAIFNLVLYENKNKS